MFIPRMYERAKTSGGPQYERAFDIGHISAHVPYNPSSSWVRNNLLGELLTSGLILRRDYRIPFVQLNHNSFRFLVIYVGQYGSRETKTKEVAIQ